MSLLKIPLLLVSAIGIHVSVTSPSRPPSSEEKVVPSLLESFIRRMLGFHCLEFMKISAWAASSAEVANILVVYIGPSQIPESIYGARVVQILRALRPTAVSPAFLAGSLAVAIGGALRLYCMSTLGRFWSFQLSVRNEHRLVTSGPYSVVRHPSYTGFLLQCVGIIFMYGSQGSWMRQSGILQVPFVQVLVAINFLLVVTGVWVSISRPAEEDKMLQRALGKEWENWAERVEYRLLPGVY
ncbi:hypothetical protein DEU56DRAFT_889605 [Suillus clintonianus]|uniref:uncharacterized protein n=1 Tax=Suillus clintonianus TaxID=1904413 RepID=UPI001B86F667|nr:uncharacterized protein DEU56DRAFT_889605 [Suillus clintonianus]KAG2131642.1 hypothetical protein DEU56DRAFT_889605 [Suillus clintonianus]